LYSDKWDKQKLYPSTSNFRAHYKRKHPRVPLNSLGEDSGKLYTLYIYVLLI